MKEEKNASFVEDVRDVLKGTKKLSDLDLKEVFGGISDASSALYVSEQQNQ